MAQGWREDDFADGKGAHFLVACIVISGLALRLWGISYGLPFVFHPDENRQILDALAMAERLSPIPQEFSYPALHKYVLLIANAFYYAVGRALGWFADPADFALKFLIGESSVFLVGRVASVVAGVLTGFAVYVFARKAFSGRAGLIGLVYSMGMYQLVQHSQWAIGDIFLALLSAVALYYIIEAYKDAGCQRKTMLAFLFTGLAVSTKPQGLFLLVPLASGQAFALIEGRKGLTDRGFYKTRAVGLFVLGVTALIGNLSWVFEFDASLEKFRALGQVASVGISSREPFTQGALSLTAWFVKDLVRQEGPLGFVLVAGVAYSAVNAVIRRSKSDFLFLSYAAVFFFAMRDWAIRYLHLFVALFPVMCVYGARLTDDFLNAARSGKFVSAAIVLAMVSPSVAGSIEASVIKSNTDTRVLAKGWIEENIPPGAAIAVDWHEFSIPLWASTPVYLRNPKAEAFFEKNAPDALKNGYESFIRSKKLYGMVPAVYSTAAPNWPAEMPLRAIEQAGKREALRELYSVFNFRTVEELRGLGAGYLVITSYGYTNFLLDTDPEKRADAVFNYLFKEDLLAFNKQSEAYIDDGRFGLLFHLNRRARAFYEPLLRGSSGAVLVKEFLPSPRRPGPVVKIYRLHAEGNGGAAITQASR